MMIVRSVISVLLLIFATGLVSATERVFIPAGIFLMGCSQADDACDVDEGPEGGSSVYTGAFKIDKHEVSVAEYRLCVEAGKCDRPKDNKRNKYCNYDAVKRDNFPVNCVDWKPAQDYCQWKGGRLPFEAEWEKAARAGSVTRYFWGQEVSCKHAILDDGVTKGSVPDEPDGCGEDRSWQRGSRPANNFGLYDMHGNVGEWIFNCYAKKCNH